MPLVDMVSQALQNANSVGWGTNLESVFSTANAAYERIVIFSDMQVWHGNSVKGRTRYENAFGCKTWVHAFDLAGHGTSQLPVSETRKSRNTMLAGFSEKVLEMLASVEQNPEILIDAIDEVSL
jgi:hypothetical protein